MGKTSDVTKNNVNYCTQVLMQSALKTFPAEVISVKGHKDQRRISFSHDQTGDQPQKDDVVSEEQNSMMRRSLLEQLGKGEFGKLFQAKKKKYELMDRHADPDKRYVVDPAVAWEAAMAAADRARSIPERSAEEHA